MNIAMFALFPDGHEWRNIQPAVVYFLLFSFFPGAQTGDLIRDHLGIGAELVLPDQTKLRFVVLD
jgi:hypothetical protein